MLHTAAVMSLLCIILVLTDRPTAAGAVEVRREVVSLAGFDLPATLVFDYPSVAEMAEYLAGLLPAPGKQRRKAHAQLQPVAAGSSGSGARSSATVPVAAVPAPEAALIDSRHKLELATAKVSSGSGPAQAVVQPRNRGHSVVVGR